MVILSSFHTCFVLFFWPCSSIYPCLARHESFAKSVVLVAPTQTLHYACSMEVHGLRGRVMIFPKMLLRKHFISNKVTPLGLEGWKLP